MKFGYISGGDLRAGNIPKTPESISYTRGENSGTTHNVIQEKVIVNCHGNSQYQRINGQLEQIYFQVPENVRIFFYTLPGKLTMIHESIKTSDICNDTKFENITYVSEPNEPSPEFLLYLNDPVYEEYKLILPFIFFCNESTGYNLNQYAIEELDLNVNNGVHLSYFVNRLSENFPNLFLNIHMLSCNSPTYEVQRELESYKSINGQLESDMYGIEANMAAMSLDNPRIPSNEEFRYNRKLLSGLENDDNHSNLTPQQLDKLLNFGKKKSARSEAIACAFVKEQSILISKINSKINSDILYLNCL